MGGHHLARRKALVRQQRQTIVGDLDQHLFPVQGVEFEDKNVAGGEIPVDHIVQLKLHHRVCGRHRHSHRPAQEQGHLIDRRNDLASRCNLRCNSWCYTTSQGLDI